MADNVPITPGTGRNVASDQVTYSGDVADVQLVRVVSVTGAEGSKTVTDSPPNAGDVPHDTADTGNPVKMGFKAEASLAGATLVADADRTDGYADLDGVQIVKAFAPFGDLLSERVTNTDGASTALSTFGATASARNIITYIVVHNSSTANAFIDFRDGTAGTVMLTLPLPAGGGAMFQPCVPLRQTTANTALAYDVSAATTTVYISVGGFKSKA